ncbi:MAG: TlpA family protein disulfide reductase [Cellulosilyticaceae bacterium]
MKSRVILFLILTVVMSTICGCATSSNEEIVEDFLQLEAVDFEGEAVQSSIFSDYDATIVNVWYTGCVPCIDEMPYLEKVSQEFKEENINFIGIATDISDSDENFALAREIIATQGVTYKNLKPIKDSKFEKECLDKITAFPSTYVVNKEGEIIGGPITGALDDYSKNKIKQLIDQQQ